MDPVKVGDHEELSISVNKSDLETGARAILSVIRPHWQHRHITFQRLVGGFVNTLLCCHDKADHEKMDAIVIRIFSFTEGNVLFDHDAELVGLRIAHETASGQPLYATFKNGMAYRYAPGRCLTWPDMHQQSILKLLAETVARFHSHEDKGCGINVKIDAEKPAIFHRIYKSSLQIPKSRKEILEKQTSISRYRLTQSEVQEELRKLQDFAGLLQSKIRFCHNDVYTRNIIYNEKTEGMFLIDFESGGYNYEAVDLATWLCSLTVMQVFGVETMEAKPVSDEDIRIFARNYLSKRKDLCRMKPLDVTEPDISKCFTQIKAFDVIVHFYFGIVSLANACHPSQECNSAKFDLWKYSDSFLEYYYSKRDYLYSLKI